MFYSDIDFAYKKYEDTLKQLSKAYQVNGMDSDDLLQEFAIVLIRCNNNYDETRGVPFKTYLVSSCINKVKDFWRKKNSTFPILNDQISEDGTERLDTMGKNEDYPDLLNMLSDIAGGYVTKLWLAGETLQEIADAYGISVSTVHRIHQENLNFLRSYLEK